MFGLASPASHNTHGKTVRSIAMSHQNRIIQCGLLLTTICVAQDIAVAQLDFEREPINYSDTEPTDRVFQLGQQLAQGEVTLSWDAKYSYLPSLLKELDIPVSSQTLVFSKTSLHWFRLGLIPA